jgi:hypothetical protein
MSRCRTHSGTYDQILLSVRRLLSESCFLVSVGCPLWRKVESVICLSQSVVICQCVYLGFVFHVFDSSAMYITIYTPLLKILKNLRPIEHRNISKHRAHIRISCPWKELNCYSEHRFCKSTGWRETWINIRNIIHIRKKIRMCKNQIRVPINLLLFMKLGLLVHVSLYFSVT